MFLFQAELTRWTVWIRGSCLCFFSAGWIWLSDHELVVGLFFLILFRAYKSENIPVSIWQLHDLVRKQNTQQPWHATPVYTLSWFSMSFPWVSLKKETVLLLFINFEPAEIPDVLFVSALELLIETVERHILGKSPRLRDFYTYSFTEILHWSGTLICTEFFFLYTFSLKTVCFPRYKASGQKIPSLQSFSNFARTVYNIWGFRSLNFIL